MEGGRGAFDGGGVAVGGRDDELYGLHGSEATYGLHGSEATYENAGQVRSVAEGHGVDATYDEAAPTGSPQPTGNTGLYGLADAPDGGAAMYASADMLAPNESADYTLAAGTTPATTPATYDTAANLTGTASNTGVDAADYGTADSAVDYQDYSVASTTQPSGLGATFDMAQGVGMYEEPAVMAGNGVVDQKEGDALFSDNTFELVGSDSIKTVSVRRKNPLFSQSRGRPSLRISTNGVNPAEDC